MVLVLFGGAVADRVERKPLIQMTQAGFAVISLLIALAIVTDVVTWKHLLAASMLQGAMFAFGGPARQALIPQIVGPERLTNAIALNSSAMSATSLVSPAIAGVLYGIIGPEGVYLLMAAVGLVAVTLTSFVRKPPTYSRTAGSAMLREILAGLSYIRDNTLILVLLAVGLATILIAMPFQMLLPVFVVDVYGRESEAFGLLVSALGLGALGGSLAVASMGRWRRGRLLIAGGFVAGLALSLVALIPVYWVAVGIMVLLGLGNVAPTTISQALIMERVEDQYRGRVMSIVMMSWSLMPVGVVPLGLAVDSIGGRPTVGIMARALLTVSTVVLVTQRRLRQIQ